MPPPGQNETTVLDSTTPETAVPASTQQKRISRPPMRILSPERSVASPLTRSPFR